MLSAFSTFPSTDGLFGIPFPPFEGGFTPWDFQEPLFPFPPQETFSPNETTPHQPVMSNSGSDNSNPKPVVLNSGSGSDEPNRSGSYEPNWCGSVVPDERKIRRMISNRESARRSRMRKKKHLENLRSQVNRFRVMNRDLKSRMQLVTHHCQLVRTENERFESELAMLKQRLWAIHQVLLVRELQQFSTSPSSA